MRASFVSTVLLGTLGVAATALAAPNRHLFLDPASITRTTGAALVVNPPTARQIAIRPDREWEQLMITFYLSVIDEGGKLRMWYVCRDKDNSANLAYAESTDGEHWRKPDLGVASYHGSKANNLVGIPNLEGNVFRDPHAATERERYVYVSSVYKGGGTYRFTSPDGYTWTRDPAPLLPFEADSQNVTLWDPQLNKYVLFFRGWNRTDPQGRQRVLVRLEADRLDRPLGLAPSGLGAQKGEPARAPLISNEAPTVLRADDRDPEQTDVYTNAIQRYPLATEWYVGFPSFYRHATDSRQRNDGRTETQFIASRDGVSWERYDRRPYVRPGLPGSENASMVYMGAGFVIRGDEIWQFGTGYRTTHGDVEGRKQRTDGVIYRYVQRLDGFVSLSFPASGGEATTRPVPVDGAALCCNVDPAALGELRIGLQTPDGRDLPGFTTAECTPVLINATRTVISWAGGDLGRLRGQEVRLHLTGREAKLYSFWFE